MKRFQGKRIFITGAGSGFGQRTAEKFADEGAAEIFLVDILQDRLDIVTKEIKKRGSNPVPLCFDVANAGQCSGRWRTYGRKEGALNYVHLALS